MYHSSDWTGKLVSFIVFIDIVTFNESEAVSSQICSISHVPKSDPSYEHIVKKNYLL